MSVPLSTLVHASALAAAVPQLTVSFDTHGGSTVIVGEFSQASMCAQMFRHVVAGWPVEGGHEPCVDQIHFDGAVERGPVLATGAQRWFVSELAATDVVSVARAARAGQPRIDTQVRFDTILGVTVIRMESEGLSSDALDEAATLLYAACLAEHLIRAAAHV